MKPYYSDELVTLYHGDCLDVLPHVTGVQVVLTSPPYNLSEGGHRVRGSEWSGLDGGYSSYADDMPHDEYVAWQRSVLTACWGTLTHSGAIYYQHKPVARGPVVRLPFDLVPDGMPLRQVITWDRGSGFQRSHWHYVPRVEWVLVLAGPDFRITTLDVFDLWKITPESGHEHPAPFPLSLAARVMDTTGHGPVLDPFAGSGTTLVAAKADGRRAIGVELDERYCEIAAKRLAQGVLDFGASAS